MVSIICPIFNEEKYIAKCINSILEQDYPKDDLEVLFVDGMSKDKTRDIIKVFSLEYPFIKLLDNPDKYVPQAMNKGIEASKGDIIIRIDAHAIFPKKYLSTLVRYQKDLNADNVGGVMETLPANNSLQARAIATALSSSFGMGNSYFRVGATELRQVDTVPFGCFPKRVFETVGTYDEELTRNQDDELNGRVIKNGGKIYLIPNLVIKYFARDSISKTRKMFYQYGLYKPLVNKKLGSPATIRQFFPLMFVLGLIVGVPLLFIHKLFLYIYISILCIYLIGAVMFAIKDSKDKSEVLILPYIYLNIHISYGWGYLVGMYKIFTGSKFEVKTNR